MSISLNKLFAEIYGASSKLQEKLERLYPIHCNIHIDGLPSFSLDLTEKNKKLSFLEFLEPQFSLLLSLGNAFSALKYKKVASKSIDGDSELAMMFLGAIAQSNIDVEIIVYKYFGAIPALLIRQTCKTKPLLNKIDFTNQQITKLQQSFRDISIRIDRLAQVMMY